MFSSLSLLRVNVGALNVFLGAMFSSPVNLVLSVFLWTCHLQPSRPTLPPPHFSPNSDLMPTSCWPLTHILSFFFSSFASGAFIFISFLPLESPTFVSLPSVKNIPHTETVFFRHPLGGGGDPLSFSLLLFVTLFCVHHSCLYSSFSLAPFLFFSPLCPSPYFPFPFFSPPYPPAWLHVHQTFIAHPLLHLHGCTGRMGSTTTNLSKITALKQLNQKTSLCMACKYWEWLLPVLILLNYFS